MCNWHFCSECPNGQYENPDGVDGCTNCLSSFTDTNPRAWNDNCAEHTESTCIDHCVWNGKECKGTCQGTWDKIICEPGMTLNDGTCESDCWTNHKMILLKDGQKDFCVRNPCPIGEYFTDWNKNYRYDEGECGIDDEGTLMQFGYCVIDNDDTSENICGFFHNIFKANAELYLEHHVCDNTQYMKWIYGGGSPASHAGTLTCETCEQGQIIDDGSFCLSKIDQYTCEHVDCVWQNSICTDPIGKNRPEGTEKCKDCDKTDYECTGCLINQVWAYNQCLTVCPAGSSGTINRECTACPIGKYSDVGWLQCGECPPGYTNTLKGQSGCFKTTSNDQKSKWNFGQYDGESCEAGKYSNDFTECKYCPRGYHDIDRIYCERCEPGKYTDDLKECKNCPEDFFKWNVNDNECSMCPIGFTNNADYTECDTIGCSTVETTFQEDKGHIYFVTDCTTVTTQTLCKNGCTWDIEQRNYGPTDTEREKCSAKTVRNQVSQHNVCIADVQCKWEYVGDPRQSVFSQTANCSVIETEPLCKEFMGVGCTWKGSECETAICSVIETEALCKELVPGCTWKHEDNSCLNAIITANCRAIETEASCTAGKKLGLGCTWKDNECFTNDAFNCKTKTDEEVCEKKNGCTWKGTECYCCKADGYFEPKSCSSQNTDVTCEDAGCTWDGTNCLEEIRNAKSTIKYRKQKINSIEDNKPPSCNTVHPTLEICNFDYTKNPTCTVKQTTCKGKLPDDDTFCELSVADCETIPGTRFTKYKLMDYSCTMKPFYALLYQHHINNDLSGYYGLFYDDALVPSDIWENINNEMDPMICAKQNTEEKCKKIMHDNSMVENNVCDWTSWKQYTRHCTVTESTDCSTKTYGQCIDDCTWDDTCTDISVEMFCTDGCTWGEDGCNTDPTATDGCKPKTLKKICDDTGDCNGMIHVLTLKHQLTAICKMVALGTVYNAIMVVDLRRIA